MRQSRSLSILAGAVIIALALLACTTMITRSLVRIKSDEK
jgi:hypothetical protein